LVITVGTECVLKPEVQTGSKMKQEYNLYHCSCMKYPSQNLD